MLRVGVTGHRRFDRVREVARQVDELMDRLVDRSDHDCEVWSSLAEGADRVVAHSGIDRGAALVVVLPLDRADYRTDFGDDTSRREFDDLCDLAHRVIDPPPLVRPEAYAWAGRQIVSSVDALVALWDGRPARGEGGTAEVIAAARAESREVHVIAVTREETER